MNQKRMAVIGAGMMGRAIISGMIQKDIFPVETIFVSDVDAEKVRRMHAELGVSAAASNPDGVQDAEVVLLAVKPQFLPSVLAELKGKIPPDGLVISIVAGVPTDVICSGLDHPAVVRVMPNTPAQTGDGVSGWYATEEVTEAQKEQTILILSGLGIVIPFEKESDLNIVTAVSGSGPAYVFLFIEAMIDTAVQMGIPRNVAEKLAVQTVKGSAAYLEKSGDHPAILRNEVTSPGGTTAEALYYLEKGGLRSTLSRAIWACYERTIELGEGGLRRKGPAAENVKVFFDTVGCRLNQAEIERFASQFRSQGYEIAACHEEADVVVINTCAVTAATPEKTARQMLLSPDAGRIWSRKRLPGFPVFPVWYPTG